MSGDPGSRHWPTEIRLKQAERILEVDFDNGVTFMTCLLLFLFVSCRVRKGGS